jgi:hypothetical protein
LDVVEYAREDVGDAAPADAAHTGGLGVDRHRRSSSAVSADRSGVHIKAIADLLGWHSSIAITGDIYGHSSDAAALGAMDGLSGTLGL